MILDKSTANKFYEWLELANSDGAVALINKDLNWTSFDVVAKLRNLLKIRKVGHAGTLDPLASGLLILCFGRYTKKVNEFQDLSKTYTAKVKIGATTKTDDSEMPEENIKDISYLQSDDIVEVVNSFVGVIEQCPPNFSAKKIDGVRLYKLARQNKDVNIKSVKVTIHNIENINVNLPFIDFQVNCSKGTYIRSLARDIGVKLGTGAYLTALHRSAIGKYLSANALNIKEITELVNEFPVKENK